MSQLHGKLFEYDWNDAIYLPRSTVKQIDKTYVMSG